MLPSIGGKRVDRDRDAELAGQDRQMFTLNGLFVCSLNTVYTV